MCGRRVQFYLLDLAIDTTESTLPRLIKISRLTPVILNGLFFCTNVILRMVLTFFFVLFRILISIDLSKNYLN